jgi:hypothetical protein
MSMSSLNANFVDNLSLYASNINIKHFFDLNEKTQNILRIYKCYVESQRRIIGNDFFADFETYCYFNDDRNQLFITNYPLHLTEDIPITSSNPSQFIENNVIILRDYMNQKKLLGCCGYGKQQTECGYVLDECEREEYRSKHNHSEYYTIDQCIGVAPDCIASFENATFPFINDGSIDEICFEGGRFQPTDIFMNEMKRILADGGVVTKLTDDNDRFQPQVMFQKNLTELVFNTNIRTFYKSYPDFFSWNEYYNEL